MNHHSITRAIFLAGMVFASGAYAGTEINKCVTPSGSVTLTDAACPSDARTIKVISVAAASDGEDSEASAEPARPTIERYTISRMPSRYVAPRRANPPARGLSLDVSTLKAARLNMHLFDNAMQAMKSQRVAGLQ